MKQLKLASLALAGAVALTACSDDAVSPIAPDANAPALSQSATGPQTTGNHLVVFKAESIPAGFAARVAALGGTIVLSTDVLGAATVAGLDAKAVSDLQKDHDVSYVEPELLLQLPEPASEPQTEGMDAAPASPSNPAGAYFFARQWNMRAIDAPQAWAAGYLGSKSVTVGILDTGIGYTHPDLVGLVDLQRSRSFLPEEDAVVQQLFPGANNIADLGYHGTHVAATVASNAIVAAGVTSKTTLMGVKVCGTAVVQGCPGGAIFAGLRYAVDAGADVINMSLGGSFTKSDYPGYVSTINRAFNYAHRKGVTVVVSAGNSSADLDHDGNSYKTYCNTPNNFCVSATGPTGEFSRTGPFENVDAPAYYTNYGRSAINVAAPGGNSGGYVYAACSTFSIVIPVCRTGAYIVGLAGTSMAAPHTSGLAALMVAKYGKDTARVTSAIEQTADDLGQNGTDPYYGKGRINVYNAVTQ